MRPIIYLKIMWIGWPAVLFFTYWAYAQAKTFVCITPNSTLYQYCDWKFISSANGILGSLLLMLFAIGWGIAWMPILFGDSKS